MKFVHCVFLVTLWFSSVNGRSANLVETKVSEKLLYGVQVKDDGTRCLGACQCYDSEYTVDCSEKGYAVIPYDIPTQVKVLDLGGNDIDEITSIDFRCLRNIEKLDLSHNSIVAIADRSFQDISALEILKLGHNRIQELRKDIFAGLSSLAELDLQYESLNYIPPGAFSHLTSLKTLNLDFNAIFSSSLTNESFSGLTELTSLSMAASYLIEIPMDSLISIKNTLNSLTMSYASRMIDIGGSASSKIDLPQLENLNLSFCSIQSILGRSLRGMPNLKNLDLTGNYILALFPQTFAGVLNLTTLRLGQNPLQTFPYTALGPVSQTLSYLHMGMSFTQIGDLSSIYDATFLSNLTTLIFEQGKLEAISGNSFFKNLKSLEYLKIAKTNLKAIPTAAMNHLARLRIARLTDNPISKLEVADIPKLDSLREFVITGTDVSLLGEDIFAGLSLTTLRLSDNKITNISSKTFLSLSHLEVIDISNNLLEMPKDEWFAGQTLQEVIVRGNPWRCDCNAEKYRAWTETLEYKSIPRIDPVECYEPRLLRTSHLSSLNAGDLTCDFSQCPSACVCTGSAVVKRNHAFSSKFDLHKAYTRQDINVIRSTSSDARKNILDVIRTSYDENKDLRAATTSAISDADCTGSKLTEIPRLPNTTEFLNVATNQISSLRVIDFNHLSSLAFFIGSENVIDKIENETFSGSSKLEKIYLNRNKIPGSLSPRWFNNLTMLRELRLDDNHLEEISSKAFATLASLEILDLSENILSSLGNDTFVGLSKLEYLNLANNYISSVQERTFHGLTKLTYLDLNANSLTNIPSNMVLENKLLLYLDISANSFGALQENFLHSESIEFLLLENGYNPQLTNGSFQSLPNLKVLRLAGSAIKEIQDGAFFISSDNEYESGQSYNRSKITTLDLGFNQLKEVPLKSLSVLTSLESLSLNHNLLSELPHWVDEEKKILSSLKTLYLTGNTGIAYVPNDSFISQLQNLLALVMNDCILTQIPLGALKNLPKLRHLVLNQNPIVQIPNDLSALLPGLEQIQLSDTGTLNFIPESAFQNLKNLTLLSLSQGKVQAIPPQALKGLENLEVLDLSRNELSRPHSEWFVSLDSRKVKSISLHHNPWVCDCNITEYKQWIDGGADGLDEHFVSVICETPQMHKSLTISEVNSADLPCDSLPEGCSMCTFNETMKLTNCSMQGLGSFPRCCVPSNTVKLDISNNTIVRLAEEDFQGLDNLEELNLSGNLISDISVKAFVGLASIKILDMSSNKLSEVPTEALSPLNITLQELALDNQNISYLMENAFPLPHLQVLSLTNLAENQGRTLVVQDFSFTKLSNLKTLDLSNNELTSSLRRNTFAGLKNLTELNLANTKLKEFPLESMTQAPSLIQLNLNENVISSLGTSDVPIMTNLKKLYMRKCEVELITEKSFLANCASLEELDLGYSLLPSVPTTALQNKPSLRLLRLDYSHISELSSYDFPPGNLTNIDFTGSRIQKIGASAFAFMNGLSKLDVKANYITEIASDAFLNVGLRYLDISNNQLAYVSCSWFDSMSDGQLHTLKLSGNNYHCSCEMVGYRDYMSTMSYSDIENAEEPICNSPTEFAGESLGDIELTDLETYCTGDVTSSPPVYCGAVFSSIAPETTAMSTTADTTTSSATYFSFRLVAMILPVFACYSQAHGFML